MAATTAAAEKKADAGGSSNARKRDAKRRREGAEERRRTSEALRKGLDIPGAPEDASDATKRPYTTTERNERHAKKSDANGGALKNGGPKNGAAAGRATPAGDAFKAPAPVHRGGNPALPRMPPPSKAKPTVIANPNPTLMQSTHRSIFLAGGAVPNVDRIAEDFGKRGAPSVAVAYAADGGGGNGNGVVDQIFESGKHVEVILGARMKAASQGDAISAAPAVEYLVKWIGHSHIHNSWMAEDPLDQLAPAKFGEYVLQYGRVPRMLADERWSKPQRVVAALRVGGSPAATSDPERKSSLDSRRRAGGAGGARAVGTDPRRTRATMKARAARRETAAPAVARAAARRRLRRRPGGGSRGGSAAAVRAVTPARARRRRFRKRRL